MSKNKELIDLSEHERKPLSILDILSDESKKKIKEDDYYAAAFLLFNESPRDFADMVDSDVKAHKLLSEAAYHQLTPEENPIEYGLYLHKTFLRLSHVIKKLN